MTNKQKRVLKGALIGLALGFVLSTVVSYLLGVSGGAAAQVSWAASHLSTLAFWGPTVIGVVMAARVKDKD